MSNKHTETYIAIFKYIEDNVFAMQPSSFMTDFENGLRKAVVTCYPHVRLRGCWYHYCAAIRRKSMSHNLRGLIKENDKAIFIHRQMLSIPLLPSESIEDGYNIVKQNAVDYNLQKGFEPIFEYFEKYWLKLVS